MFTKSKLYENIGRGVEERDFQHNYAFVYKYQNKYNAICLLRSYAWLANSEIQLFFLSGKEAQQAP